MERGLFGVTMLRLPITFLAIGITCCQLASAQADELYRPALTGAEYDASVSGYQLSLLSAPALDLAPLSLSELTAGRSQNTGDIQSLAISMGERLVVPLPMRVPDLPAYIRREIPSVWQITVPSGSPSSRLPLRFQWEDYNLNAEVTAAHLKPTIHPWKHTQRYDDAGHIVIEGGVYIDIPVAALDRTDRYRGRIIILLEEI